jgi:hypothetical protein
MDHNRSVLAERSSFDRVEFRSGFCGSFTWQSYQNMHSMTVLVYDSITRACFLTGPQNGPGLNHVNGVIRNSDVFI